MLKTGAVNSSSVKWSLALHGLLLVAAVVVPLLPIFRPKEVVVPQEFTVVLEQNLTPPNIPPQVEPKVAVKEPEPEPEMEPEPDVPEPAPLPEPPKDALAIEKKEKPKPPKPTKVEEKTPPKPEPKKEFKKGTRVTRKETAPVAAPQPKEDFTKLKPVSTKPVTEKVMSRADIDKALREGARPGVRNSIPEDEISRCVVLVKNALYEAWEQPGDSDAGSRPALLDIQLDSAGRIVSYKIRTSSGSAFFDQTVLKAAANAPPIRGLSLAFLRQYETFTVEFKLQ